MPFFKAASDWEKTFRLIRETMGRKNSFPKELKMEKENSPESEKPITDITPFRVKGLTEHMRANHSDDELNKMGLELGGPVEKTQQTITARIEGGQTSSNLEDHLERPVTLQDMRKAMEPHAQFDSTQGEIERPRPVPNATLYMDALETKLILSMETIREQLGPNVQIIARSDLIKTGQDIIKNQPDDLNVFLNELADRIFGKENQNGK